MLDSINENSKEDLLLFEEFKQTVLIEGNSFFNKKIKIFSEKNFSTFEDRYIKNYISDKNYSFLEKIDLQTSNTTDSFKHLFANYLWLYNYFFSSIRNHRYYKVGRTLEAKIKDVSFLLGKDLNENFFPKYGFANCGISYTHNKYEEVCVIHIFMKKLFENKDLIYKEELEKEIKLINVKNELEFYRGKEYKKAGIKAILLFLLFPNKYEPIVSYTDKNMIVDCFLEDKSDDVDKDILEIRKKFDIKTSFYTDDLLYKWNKNKQLSTVIKNKFKLGMFQDSASARLKKFIPYDEDYLGKLAKDKCQNGLLAEELVFNTYFKEFIDKKGVVLQPILQKLIDIKYIEFEDENYNKLMKKSTKDICHFSKNINAFAPFDIICPIDGKVFFVEVKSFKNSREIFFSYSELKFAFENIENYFVVIVTNNSLYKIDNLNDALFQIYNELLELKSGIGFLEIETIKIKLDVI
ncbi:protein NO VEIN domain-containing protein [Arcobacter sp.]|uniref:protein NO VEIN domain-containing protein n=1 Tax=Arcobacter sp. TaxID=1872629 RepID=UPI003C784600